MDEIEFNDSMFCINILDEFREDPMEVCYLVIAKGDYFVVGQPTNNNVSGYSIFNIFNSRIEHHNQSMVKALETFLEYESAMQTLGSLLINGRQDV